MRVLAALGIGEHVQLDLAHAVVQLFGQRRMAVVDGGERLRCFQLHQTRGAGGKAHVVAVVGADDLDLVDAQRIVGYRRRHQRNRGQRK